MEIKYSPINKNIYSEGLENIDVWGCHILNGNFTLSAYYGMGSINIQVLPSLNSTAYGQVEFLLDFASCSKKYVVDINGGEGDVFEVTPTYIKFTEQGQFDTIYVNTNLSGNISIDTSYANKIDIQNITTSSSTLIAPRVNEIEITSKSDNALIPINITVGDGKYKQTVYVLQNIDEGTITDKFEVLCSSVSGDNINNTFTFVVVSYCNGIQTDFTCSVSNEDKDDLRITKKNDLLIVEVKDTVQVDKTYSITFTQNRGGTPSSITSSISYTYISQECYFNFGEAASSTITTSLAYTSLDTLSQQVNVYSKKGDNDVRWYVTDYPSSYVTVYSTVSSLTVNVLTDSLYSIPKTGVNKTISLENIYGNVIQVEIFIQGGLIANTSYEFSGKTISGETPESNILSSNTTVLRIHSCQVQDKDGKKMHTFTPFDFESIGYLEYDTWIYKDNDWRISLTPQIVNGDDKGDVDVYFYDNIDLWNNSITPSTNTVIVTPTFLPIFNKSDSFPISFIQRETNSTLEYKVFHETLENATIEDLKLIAKLEEGLEIYASLNNPIREISTSSGSSSLTFYLYADYKYKGTTYSDINVSSPDLINNNYKVCGETYTWLTGLESFNVIPWNSSGGTISGLTENGVREDYIYWMWDANNNSFDISRSLQVEYEGKTLSIDMTQDNGDGRVEPIPRFSYDVYVSGGTSGDVILPLSGGNVILKASTSSASQIKDITKDVEWYVYEYMTTAVTENKIEIKEHRANDGTLINYYYTMPSRDMDNAYAFRATYSSHNAKNNEVVIYQRDNADYYYTFDVAEREVDFNQTQLSLSVTLYKNGEPIEVDNNQIKWLCNNIDITNQVIDGKYDIGVNTSRETPRVFKFHAECIGYPLKQDAETVITVTQGPEYEIWLEPIVTITPSAVTVNYGYDQSFDVFVTQKSTWGNERNSRDYDFGLKADYWDVMVYLEIISSSPTSCTVRYGGNDTPQQEPGTNMTVYYELVWDGGIADGIATIYAGN